MSSSLLPAHYTEKKKPKPLPLVEVRKDYENWLSDSVPIDEWRKNREEQIAGTK